MISPRLARRIASLHKWLGLIVGVQVLIWTATGLFFTVIHITQIRGEHLVHAEEAAPVDMARVKLSSTEALAAIAEDRPHRLVLRSLAGEPVYEVRAEIGLFLVSAETGRILSPVPEDTARAVVLAAWAADGELTGMDLLEQAPREAGFAGAVWAARFSGPGNRTLYINALTGERGPVRTDLWRTYDFLWSLHIMDYDARENFNHPLIIAAAVLALSVVLFGIALLVHRFTRQLSGSGKGASNGGS